MKIAEIVTLVRSGKYSENDWLYVADGEEPWEDAEYDLGEAGFDEEKDEELYPPGFAERGLGSTIDIETLKDCIHWADRFSGRENDAIAIESILYYLDNDAFSPEFDSSGRD